MKTNLLKIAFVVLSCSLFLNANGQCTPDPVTPNLQINGGAWESTGEATVGRGGSVWFGPNPGWLPGTWSWFGPNEFTASERAPVLTNIQPEMAGDYLVIFVNAGGCSSQYTFKLTVTSDPIVCTPSAITPFTQINGGEWVSTGVASVAAGDSVYFGPADMIGGSWNWTGPNGITASERGLKLTNIQPNQSGNYVVTFINGCGSSSQYTFTLTVGPNSVNSPGSSLIDIFPNPAIDFVNVNNAKGAEISIFDSLGKVVLKSNCADDLTKINIAGLFNGFYMVQAQIGKEIVTQKLIITK